MTGVFVKKTYLSKYSQKQKKPEWRTKKKLYNQLIWEVAFKNLDFLLP